MIREPMSQAERRAVRGALVEAGFDRRHFTRDHGDGQYNEIWGRVEGDGTIAAVVTIQWGRRGELDES